MKVNTYIEIINDKNFPRGGIKDAGILKGILLVAFRDREVSTEDFNRLLSFVKEYADAKIIKKGKKMRKKDAENALDHPTGKGCEANADRLIELLIDSEAFNDADGKADAKQYSSPKKKPNER